MYASKIAIILSLWSDAQETEKFLGSRSRQLKKPRFFALAILLRCKSIIKVFTQADRALELNSFTNMVTKIDVDALKI